MAAVTIREAAKQYGAVKVLHGVSLDIDDGEFIVLVGPSGCGKSTLLRMIAGLEEISGGEVEIGSRVVNNIAPKQRDIAMVFQSYALYPHMSVRDNMSFALKLKGTSKEERERKVMYAAQILGLESLLDRYPRQLSGGQRQRVAMGRAIVRDPKVFLFDEPLSNLDAKLRVQMRAEIKALHHRLKVTTIYVTHDQIEAMTMADRIVVMQGGRIEQIGEPLDLYDRPANLFVATFIGSPAMNVLEGTIVDHGGQAVRISDSIQLQLMSQHPALPLGARVKVGFRPESVKLSSDGFEATVVVVEPTGSETQVNVTVDGLDLVTVFRERITARPDEKLRITVDAEKLHVFDMATGKRL
jgi:multiple sugar transport system ATP-binding protein